MVVVRFFKDVVGWNVRWERDAPVPRHDPTLFNRVRLKCVVACVNEEINIFISTDVATFGH